MIRLALIFCLCAAAVFAGPRPVSNISKPYGRPVPGVLLENHGRIVGGVDTDITAVPYQVVILRRNQQHCGGSILSSRFILTAAHCLRGVSKTELTIRSGSNYYGEGGTVHKVKNTLMHPLYNSREHDIGIIELLTPIKSSSGSRAITLADREPKAGDMVLLSGWGDTVEDGDPSYSLKSVKIPVISRETCQRMLRRFSVITENMWCAGLPRGGKDTCQGDSGGPAVINGKLAGVVAFGVGCARPNSPGVYTNVVKYRSWIAENARST